VFKEVGEACAREEAFVLATRFDPSLGGDDGCGGVGVEDESEAVGKGVQGGLGSGKLHGGVMSFF